MNHNFLLLWLTYKVLDIQKLASEMGLNCITTYKLDALKAVCRSSDSCTTTDLGCNDKNDGVTIQSSDLPSLLVERELMEGMNADKSCENGR